MCHNIFKAAAKSRTKLDAPTRLYPSCHKKSHIEVFVDTKHMSITLSCGKCDRVITIIKVKGHNGNPA